MELLDREFFGNSIRAWAIALSIAVAVALVMLLIRAVLWRRLGRWISRTETRWDDLIGSILSRTKWFFLLAVSVYAGSLTLDLGTGLLQRTIVKGTIILVFLQGGIWGAAAISGFLEDYRKRRLTEDPAGVTTMSAVAFLGQLALWSIVLLLVLQNVGLEIGPLLAGLGVGGIAVALAVQRILGDLLASLSIVFDKPFVVGDFLIIDDHLGAVERIGLKTTRLRSLSGEQLVFSNNDLLNSRIRNYGRMRERRAVFELGVTYQTARVKLAKVPTIIREAIEAEKQTRFDRCHFKAYGDFALVFETVYCMLVPDYNAYMDVQQAVNLRIHERFELEGIEFAYPTQTLHLVKSPKN